MRSLPNGNFVYADRDTGSLRQVTPQGEITVLMSNLNYPNGVEVSADGQFAFVTENANPGELYQINLDTLDTTRLFRGIRGANGIAISADEQKMYVGTCIGTGIVVLDRISDDEWSEPRVVHDDPNGCYDAINIDACGNVYFYGFGGLIRMSADETTFEKVANMNGWIPNARWGSGVGGWDANTMYLNNRIDQSIYVVDLGVPGKPHVHAP